MITPSKLSLLLALVAPFALSAKEASHVSTFASTSPAVAEGSLRFAPGELQPMKTGAFKNLGNYSVWNWVDDKYKPGSALGEWGYAGGESGEAPTWFGFRWDHAAGDHLMGVSRAYPHATGGFYGTTRVDELPPEFRAQVTVDQPAGNGTAENEFYDFGIYGWCTAEPKIEAEQYNREGAFEFYISFAYSPRLEATAKKMINLNKSIEVDGEIFDLYEHRVSWGKFRQIRAFARNNRLRQTQWSVDINMTPIFKAWREAGMGNVVLQQTSWMLETMHVSSGALRLRSINLP